MKSVIISCPTLQYELKAALEEASNSKRQKVAINYNNGKLSAKINDETISYNRSNSIFTFIKKVSDKILSPILF